jgi:hypothetical protein
MVGSEPLKRVGERGLDSSGPRVIAEPAAIRAALGPKFDADQRAIAVGALKCSADQHFVVAHGVEIARVDQVDARVERGMNRGDALGLVGRSITSRHPHAAESEP